MVSAPSNLSGIASEHLYVVRLSSDVKNESSLLYTRQRDIHSVGIVFMQMLLGLDVTEKYSDVHSALQACRDPHLRHSSFN